MTKHRVEPENAVLLEMNWLQSECIKQSNLNYFDGIRGLFSVLSAWLGWKQFPELTHTQLSRIMKYVWGLQLNLLSNDVFGENFV